MNRIPLRLCTVSDARDYYLKGKTILFRSFQTYNEKDEKDDNGNNPSIAPNEELYSSFILDGSLKWKLLKDQTWGIIHNWLSENNNGPYYFHSNDSQPIFYYLGGYHSEEGYSWLQICSDPLNVLSSDCLDGVHVWIPTV